MEFIQGQDNKYISYSLKDFIILYKPDFIIFYGMGYYINIWLIKNYFYNIPFFFIIGGGKLDPLMFSAKKIYTEYEDQSNFHLIIMKIVKRVSVIPKYLNNFFFELGNSKINSKSIDIISIGRLDKFKNHIALMPLLSYFTIMIIGDGPEKHDLITESLKYKNRLLILSNVAHNSIPRYISKAKIMVHPSISDGFPRVIAESLALGVPVIANKKVIKDKEFNSNKGFLVHSKKIISSANRLLKNNDMLELLSNNAFNYASANYSELHLIQFINNILLNDFNNHKMPIIKYNKVRILINIYIFYIFSPLRNIKKVIKILLRGFV